MLVRSIEDGTNQSSEASNAGENGKFPNAEIRRFPTERIIKTIQSL
jgi:hypothetical protein